MISLKPNYDHIAPIYDKLSQLVFGNTLLHAQQYLINFIPSGTSVLIVGGGSGWILEAITKIHPSGLNITYVDASEKMMTRAKKRNYGNNIITFITAAAEETNYMRVFDVIITPFFFDNFKEENAVRIFSHLESHLTRNGIWLYSDFEATKITRQRILLKLMYLFFRVFCHIEAQKLPDLTTHFERTGYAVGGRRTFMGKFVMAICYKRLTTK